MSNRLLFAVEPQTMEAPPKIPTKANKTDAGYDLYSIKGVKVYAGQTVKVHTGIHMAIPEGYYGRIADRSSMAARGLHVIAGVVDSAYRGEIMVLINNVDDLGMQEIPAGSKFAQIIITKICELDPVVVELADLPDSGRGTGGFGSSGA